MYFTDRTSLYLKIQKQFDFWPFTIAMVLALALGLGTMKKPEKDLGFLNRDQTDEVSFIEDLHEACTFRASLTVRCYGAVEGMDANCHSYLSLLRSKSDLFSLQPYQSLGCLSESGMAHASETKG